METFAEVYYYHAHYGFDNGSWEEHDEYGFMAADNFNHAMSKIVDYYRDDLMSVTIEYIGDTGMISVHNKEIAESFKLSYMRTHYQEE